jgi:hypothetical protein
VICIFVVIVGANVVSTSFIYYMLISMFYAEKFPMNYDWNYSLVDPFTADIQLISLGNSAIGIK